MSHNYFGTDGIRGRANGLITPELALKVGQAAGLVFQRGEHRHRVVIGKDTRLSGYMIEYAMVAALKHQARGLADLERELRRDKSVGAAPNAVGPEIFAAHVIPHAANRYPHHGDQVPRKAPPFLICGGCYNAITAKAASKNMMNSYGNPAPG